VEGLARQSICTLCRRRDTCPKDGLPKILPENIEAMQDFGMIKILGGVPLRDGGLEAQPARKLRLFQIIASQVAFHESRPAK